LIHGKEREIFLDSSKIPPLAINDVNCIGMLNSAASCKKEPKDNSLTPTSVPAARKHPVFFVLHL
jgi:hypothetical protein